MKDNFADIGFAKLDLSRGERTGFSEAIYCAGKTREQLLGILQKFHNEHIAVMGTHCSEEKYAFVKNAGLTTDYDPISQIISIGKNTIAKLPGKIAVCAAGTADMPVAEEAAQTAEFYGATVERCYDVGIAGLHRLLTKLDTIKEADVVIAVAGMEGALGSVIAGLVKAPVIAVPTSVGYGVSFNGLTPLLTMLSSCASGISVVNINNGYGAAVQSCRILKLMEKPTSLP